jgi:hypothetical protein
MSDWRGSIRRSLWIDLVMNGVVDRFYMGCVCTRTRIRRKTLAMDRSWLVSTLVSEL